MQKYTICVHTTFFIHEYQFFRNFTIYFQFSIDKNRGINYNNTMKNKS